MFKGDYLMAGWVYAITNESQPGMVKIGYTENEDPQNRADGLNHTGCPTPYLVDYAVETNNPHSKEKRIHKTLKTLNIKFNNKGYKKEGREWFKCSLDDAIYAIKKEVGDDIIREDFRRVSREETEREYRQKIEKSKLAKKLRNERTEKKEAINKKYDEILHNISDPGKFWGYWLASSLGAYIVLAASNVDETASIFIGCTAGMIIAINWQSYIEDSKKKSQDYISIQKKRESEIDVLCISSSSTITKTSTLHNPSPSRTKYINKPYRLPDTDKKTPKIEKENDNGMFIIYLFIGIIFFVSVIIIASSSNKSTKSTSVTYNKKTERSVSSMTNANYNYRNTKNYDTDDTYVNSFNNKETKKQRQPIKRKARTSKTGIDLRHCLELPTNKDIILCFEKNR